MDTTGTAAPSTAQAVSAFLFSKRAAGRAAKTIEALEYALGFLERAFPGELPTEPEPLEVMFAEARRGRERAIDDIWRHTKQFYRWAKGRYGLRNPFDVPADFGGLQRPRLERKHLPAFSQQDTHRILLRNEGRPREMAALLLMLDTGIRPGEAFNLRPGDVHGGFIVVHGKMGERSVPISQQTQRALLALPPGEVFWRGRKGPLTFDGFKQMMQRAFARAGLKGNPYKLRHTTATLFLANGGNEIHLQHLLGHSSTRMTSRYVSQSLTTLAQAQRRHSPIADYTGNFQAALGLVPDEGEGVAAG